MMSFSGLNQSHQTYATNDVKFKNKYDEFIFSKMGKGSVVGNLVHELLENCDFSKDQFQKQINAIGMRYPSVYKSDYIENYNKMMHEVLHANLSEDKPWSLHQVNPRKKIAELEFIFNIDHLSRQQVTALYDEVQLEGSHKLSGFMAGFVDLFFEHEGNRAVRLGKWKIVWTNFDKKWELYDIEKDRSELNDLAQEDPERVRTMDKLWGGSLEKLLEKLQK